MDFHNFQYFREDKVFLEGCVLPLQIITRLLSNLVLLTKFCCIQVGNLIDSI